MARLKPSSAKAKGRDLQKKVAEAIVSAFAPHLQEGDVVSRPMGSPGCDLIMSPLARKMFPFSLECKNTRSFPSLSGLDQSNENAYPYTLPGLTWKPPRKGIEDVIVSFRLVDFIQFCKGRLR